MSDPSDADIYDLIGEAGFTRLTAGFYAKVRQDPCLGPMYPRHDFSGAEQRLRDFLIYRFGGPPRYIQERGHPRLRRRHVAFPIDQTARDRWVSLMDQALAEAQLPDAAVAVLGPFLHHMATFMINRLDQEARHGIPLNIVPPHSDSG